MFERVSTGTSVYMNWHVMLLNLMENVQTMKAHDFDFFLFVFIFVNCENGTCAHAHGDEVKSHKRIRTFCCVEALYAITRFNSIR